MRALHWLRALGKEVHIVNPDPIAGTTRS